ncbi:MAG: dihydrodipicolinate synthase family protein, partial [Clostridia bacterium]|nr:dihydrodipicolinate synthase family protein [Clostridia bacterium]
MKKPLFRGVGTAVITPFRQGIPDLTALKKLLENQLSGNIDAIILLGTTGEASTLTYPEREKIIQTARETIPSSVPLIIGTGSNSTQYAVDYTLQAKEWGADGVLAVTPYYNKGTKDGIRKHFYAMADIGLPLLLYTVPSRTGLDLPVEAV